MFSKVPVHVYLPVLLWESVACKGDEIMTGMGDASAFPDVCAASSPSGPWSQNEGVLCFVFTQAN